MRGRGDLGLARRLMPHKSLASLTGETGTYLYMAPEVMRCVWKVGGHGGRWHV